jgi:rhamnosyltransferase
MPNILFSIIIPTYNGEKTIGNLLKTLTQFKDNYKKEVIIIDSQSQDKTLNIVNRFKKKLNLKIIKIKKEEFNHGLTRNLGLEKACGRYIWFLSQDARPIVSKKFLDYVLEDFKINKRVVVVYGKHLPYKKTPIIQKLEVECYWEKLDSLLKKEKILIHDGRKLNQSQKQQEIFIRLSNVNCFYKRSFLIKNKFKKVKTGEDMYMGKIILEKNLIKIYDPRIKVYHSHFFNLKQYYQREKETLELRFFNLKTKEKPGFLCKLKKIFLIKENLFIKFIYILQLFLFYFLKIIIILNLKIKNNKLLLIIILFFMKI